MTWTLGSYCLLIAFTLFFSLTVGAPRTYRTWTVLFLTMAAQQIFMGIYKFIDRFHTHEFWVIVSATTSACGFLFLAASVTLSKPEWKWLHWLWPILGVAGVLVGGLVAALPVAYLVTVVIINVLVSAIFLQRTPFSKTRQWLFRGIFLTLLAFVVSNFHWNSESGTLSSLTVPQWIQLLANLSFWLGARRSN